MDRLGLDMVKYNDIYYIYLIMALNNGKKKSKVIENVNFISI